MGKSRDSKKETKKPKKDKKPKGISVVSAYQPLHNKEGQKKA